MTSISWIRSAALASVFAVLAVALALIPSGHWFPDVMASLALLAVAVGLLLYTPISSATRDSDVSLLLLGPTGALYGLTVLMAGAALYAALSGYPSIAWALDVGVVGGFVIGWSLMQASANVATSVMQAAELPSDHNTWISQVHGLVPTCSDLSVKRQLAALAEQLRYVARDVPGVQLAENARITALLVDLPNTLTLDRSADFLELINSFQAALAQREQALKNLRTKM